MAEAKSDMEALRQKMVTERYLRLKRKSIRVYGSRICRFANDGYAAAMDDWTDLRRVLAISRATTLTGAAAVPQINHPNAFRRLNDLEGADGAPLFERLHGGIYPPT